MHYMNVLISMVEYSYNFPFEFTDVVSLLFNECISKLRTNEANNISYCMVLIIPYRKTLEMSIYCFFLLSVKSTFNQLYVTNRQNKILLSIFIQIYFTLFSQYLDINEYTNKIMRTYIYTIEWISIIFDFFTC